MKFLLALAIACVAFSTAVLADTDQYCTEIARFDDANSRIFVVCPSIPDMSDTQIAEAIVDVFAQLKGPPDEYFISFFATAELAGYKTDDELAEYVKSGDWAEAYVGEYYTHSHEITLWPAIPSKRVSRRLPAP